MFKIYGSEMCPDCRRCKASFDANGIVYEFIDINESLGNFKAFLKLRDKKEIFEPYKEKGKIGIPFVMGDDGIEFCDWEKYLSDQGIEAGSTPIGQACSIDGTGC